MATPLNQKITTLAAEACAAHGMVLVVARMLGGGARGRSTLEVLVETPAGTSPDVEVCAQISRLLSAQLDVEEIISGKYMLEVSSPGLERPLLSVADCARFVGKGASFKFRYPQTHEAKGKTLELGAAKGTIGAVERGRVTLVMDGGPLSFDFTDVHSAQLAPTAAELAAFMGVHEKPARGTPHPLSARAQKLKAKAEKPELH